MYNSLIVSISVRIWKAILHGYEDSIIKKLVDLINGFISYLLKGSVIGSFFTSKKDLIKETLFYKVVCKLIDFLSRILKDMNKYIEKTGQNSLVYNNINELFSGEVEILRTLFIFSFSLGIGLASNNVIRGYYSGKSYIVSIILVVGSLIGLLLKENYKEIINSSWVYNMITSIFTMDGEGGDNWW